MIILGIDLASQKQGTSACMLDIDDGELLRIELAERCSDAVLDEMIAEADAVGIDAPFGWPQPFTAAMANPGSMTCWNNDVRDQMRFRETDRFVQRTIRKCPLSVSTDRIALPALRASALLQRHNVTDKSGSNRFFEVYPGGSLKVWGLLVPGYKKSEAIREDVLQCVHCSNPAIEFSPALAATDHNFDSFVSAITALAATTGATIRPGDDQRDLARTEGWIHLPRSSTPVGPFRF